VASEFAQVVREYRASPEGMEALGDASPLTCELDHVDGTFGAKERSQLLDWLKEDTAQNCRILSNARCLSEGVDVPALDAILFMHPRKSQIDVVQSVGRVMRRAPDKKMGYVILPVGVPAGVSPEQALNDNERYKVVWQILNALRSHDERLDARLNQADLGVDISSQIEVIAVSNKLPNRTAKDDSTMNLGHGAAKGDDDSPSEELKKPEAQPVQKNFVFDEFAKAIMAKIVKKCGKRDYWENWASDIAKIAQTHITRIKGIIAKEGTREREAFDEFLAEIRDDLNESITRDEAVEMLAQHLITKPVFDALFEGYSFAENNPVSRAMQSILAILNENNLEKETTSLEAFYASVKRRAEGIDSAQAKQKIIVELYDKFFRNAFPKMTEKLGIVYTPVEVVDFIIHSVNDVLKAEFGQTLGSKGVHIIDPFTGTGTFITRLLQSGLIKPDELEYKYKNEIHANEIVLLAYYIAAINIEAVYHTLSGGDYAPFEGICLTDTFQLYEQNKDLLSRYLPDNSNRRTRQKALDLRVIMGNPPYSAGQKSANDGNANVNYPKLDERIGATYVKHSNANNKNALYDSYIRAMRWGSDRLGDAGIMAYISGSAWIERGFADGLRKCLKEEFSSLYIFHLRGDVRKNIISKGRAGEGENIFGSGTMTGVAISVMVKNPHSQEHGKIYLHDIGLHKKRNEKLDSITTFKSIAGISAKNVWQTIEPDAHHDWLAQRDNSFEAFISLGDKKDKNNAVLFENYSGGLKTQRDAWCYNFSKHHLENNITQTINFYNSELIRVTEMTANPSKIDVNDFINNDAKKVSWSANLKDDLNRKKPLESKEGHCIVSSYRPFTKEYLYYSRRLNERVYQIPRIFPTGAEDNRVIAVSGIGARAGFSALMVDKIPNLHFVDSGQNFPLYLYDKKDDTGFLEGGTTRRDAITDDGLKHFQSAYPHESITKEDIFYYVYGLLHSPQYREKYGDNLSKQLPRIPCVKTAQSFWGFVKAGRALGDLHVNYESVTPYPVTIAQGDLRLVSGIAPEALYRVEKMKFGGKRPQLDKTTVIYNPFITIQNIPLEAYDYVVNGKSALDWVMERQCIKTDKDSGIVNDANLYATETMNNPAYPLELFQRVITVSLETMKIVNALPPLEIIESKIEESAV
jgi:predicted helicase